VFFLNPKNFADMVKKAIEENTVHDKTTLDVDYKKELLDLIFQLLARNAAILCPISSNFGYLNHGGKHQEMTPSIRDLYLEWTDISLSHSFKGKLEAQSIYY
jgi:hypothetical protein